MTETTTTDKTTAATAADPTAPAAESTAPAFDAERRATELAILDALRAVVDPEIGMNVVELALIKQILLGPDSTEIKTNVGLSDRTSGLRGGPGKGRDSYDQQGIDSRPPEFANVSASPGRQVRQRIYRLLNCAVESS